MPMTSRGRFKTQRQYRGPDGFPVKKEFVQRKGESRRGVIQRANAWQVEMRGKLPAPTMTLGLAIDIYSEYRQAGPLSKDTLQDDSYVKNLLVPLHGVRIDKLDAYGIEVLLRQWQSKPRTAKKIRDYGRKLYNWLIKRKWAQSNPFSDSEPVPYEPENWDEPMPQTDFDKAFAKLTDPVVRAQILTLRWTALRPKAIRELMWSELEERENGLWIRKAMKNTKAKRPVYVPAHVAKVILAAPRSSLFVWPSHKTGRPYNESWIRTSWLKAQIAAGVDRRKVYDLKHLRVTELHEIFEGDDVKVTAAIGNKSVSVTKYAYRQIALREQVEKLESRNKVGTHKERPSKKGGV